MNVDMEEINFELDRKSNLIKELTAQLAAEREKVAKSRLEEAEWWEANLPEDHESCHDMICPHTEEDDFYYPNHFCSECQYCQRLAQLRSEVKNDRPEES